MILRGELQKKIVEGSFDILNRVKNVSKGEGAWKERSGENRGLWHSKKLWSVYNLPDFPGGQHYDFFYNFFEIFHSQTKPH